MRIQDFRKLGMALLMAAAAGTTLLARQAAGPAPAASPPTCPASGYAPQPYYAGFGQNGGDGQTAYEIASPCIGKEVRAVADTIGMARSKLTGLKNIITVQFRADGTMTDASGGVNKLANAEFHMAYYVPAIRMFLNGTRANGGPLKDIHVFATDYAWNETAEGRGATAAMAARADREPLLKLTPFGAVWSLIEAEGHTKVEQKPDGSMVLTGTSPYDGIEVSVTATPLKQKLGPFLGNETFYLPTSVTARANGRMYGATFAEWRDDLEPNVWVIFPTQIKWTLDGKPLADLKVTYFRSNPYVVFPIPDVVKQKGSSN